MEVCREVYNANECNWYASHVKCVFGCFQKWHDDYIKWNRSNDTEYRPEWMAFRPGEIWTPDIAIDNRSVSELPIVLSTIAIYFSWNKSEKIPEKFFNTSTDGTLSQGSKSSPKNNEMRKNF